MEREKSYTCYYMIFKQVLQNLKYFKKISKPFFFHKLTFFSVANKNRSQGGGAEDGQGENLSEDETAHRLNIPTIRGGLNGSIADILEASGYGTETDFKVDEESVT